MQRQPGLARWLLYKRRRGCVAATLTRYEHIGRAGIRALSRRGRPGLPVRWQESDFEYVRDRVLRSRWAYRIFVDFAQFSGNRSARMVAAPRSEASGRVRWLTPKSVRGLISVARPSPLLSLLMVLGIGQGLRRVEWKRLRVDDVDLAMGRVLVRGKGRGAPKLIWVPLHPAFPEVWRRFVKRRERLISRHSDSPLAGTIPLEALIHWTRAGFRPYSDSGLDALVRRLGSKAPDGDPARQLSSHMLRRSGATLLEDALLRSKRGSLDGVYRSVQSFLRHDNLATTMRYLQGNPTRQRQALREYAAAIPWG